MQVYIENRFYNLFKWWHRLLGMVRGEKQAEARLQGSRCRSSGAEWGWLGLDEASDSHWRRDGGGVGVRWGGCWAKLGSCSIFPWFLALLIPSTSTHHPPSLPGAELENPPTRELMFPQ